MVSRRSHIDHRYRSLVQKAVRRGEDNLVVTASALLESFGPKEKNWLRKRTIIVVFEECWPLGSELVFNKTYHSKVAALVKASRSVKTRDALGLGLLGHALSGGDPSVLQTTQENRPIRIIANAVQRPEDFWKWIATQTYEGARNSLIQNAVRFKNIGGPMESACTKAVAYLAVTEKPPDIVSAKQKEGKFPYWIVFDTQERKGRRALRDISRDLHIPKNQLEWIYFYFACGLASEERPSTWWERYCRWRFDKIGVPIQEAHLIWEPAKPQIKEALYEDSQQLHKDIYRWKMANIERVESLKKKVELYISNFHTIQKEQRALF